MSHIFRESAIGMLTAGMSTRAVACELNVHLSTISRLQRRFREFGSTSNRPHKRRSCVTTPAQDLHIQHLPLQDRLKKNKKDAKKNKKTTTREWEGMGVILPGVERDFPPVFSWDWDGKRLKFVMHFGNRRWAPGLMCHLAWETRSQRLTFSHYLGSTHILNAFGRIQMSHFNLD